MTAALTGTRSQLPDQWPAALSPDCLEVIDMPTPYLVTDLDTVVRRLEAFTAALPGVLPFYAMKCNPAPEILATMRDHGAGFEIASLGELQMLQRQGVDPAGVLYSNPVKPPAHIAAAHAAGLWRFSFDSPNELRKLAEHAPGSAVYLRLRVDDSASSFPLSRKFGAEVHEARDLLVLARRLGLRPYGVTFHVGSQCGNAAAWREAIGAVGQIMADLLDEGIRLDLLDLGGGFPARYTEDVPTIGEIGEMVLPALDELLPYRPGLLVAEPGRHLVAEASVMAVSVIGREVRGTENWLFVDVGAYNGMMETIQLPTGWDFPMWTSVAGHGEIAELPFTITGPSCDSSDTMFYGALLPAGIDVGDIIYIGSTGAYTLSYASAFNGFPPPTPLFVGGPATLPRQTTGEPARAGIPGER
ncbi:type III PLP-dependent enzyme [Actinoplanes friuliensis]|uniref:ornithine decarboxylase n=1 Tax=Actinoplanes friuliensis DSM 7358 TaxID=1246995 RepID=U5W781_9ACTN|nr:type III PLP-dependent enzyme [Actinoplanes friuliensis]AGZ44999.1 ornithine decarboxylase [Actinoplanes friuliensis DSM 7358]